MLSGGKRVVVDERDSESDSKFGNGNVQEISYLGSGFVLESHIIGNTLPVDLEVAGIVLEHGCVESNLDVLLCGRHGSFGMKR